MLALRMGLCNDRWDEGWQKQTQWQQQTHSMERRRKQQQRFLRRQQTQPHVAVPLPSCAPPQQPKPSTGRTVAQYRWGRQTFSPRMLRQGGLAKN